MSFSSYICSEETHHCPTSILLECYHRSCSKGDPPRKKCYLVPPSCSDHKEGHCRQADRTSVFCRPPPEPGVGSGFGLYALYSHDPVRATSPRMAASNPEAARLKMHLKLSAIAGIIAMSEAPELETKPAYSSAAPPPRAPYLPLVSLKSPVGSLKRTGLE